MAIDTRGSYTAHAALSVSSTYEDGTAWTLTIKDLDEVPDGTAVDASIADGEPIMFPVFFEGTGGGTVPTTTAGTGDVLLNVTFLCCVNAPRVIFENKNPKTGEMDTLCDIGPKAIDVHNTYITALFNDDDLDGSLDYALEVSTEIGAYHWAGKLYSGFMVRHVWRYLVG